MRILLSARRHQIHGRREIQFKIPGGREQRLRTIFETNHAGIAEIVFNEP